MVFSSTPFVFLFLPIVLGLYFAAPRPIKNSLLLCASLLFYAWGEGALVLLLLASTAFNYGAARLIARHRTSPAGTTLLAVGVCANLSILVYYKYAGFVLENYNQFGTLTGIPSIDIGDIRLPIGISFFTFQAVSYLVDVHRGTAEAQPRFIEAALYIALFAQLVAGPIVRYHDVAGQLQSRLVTLDLFAEGVRRFIIGLGKKVLIANPLGFTADQVFAIPAHELTWALSWLGILCYTLQIYFDFSGYSDMAIGLGRMFGFRFLENFNYPYISRSIREFWRRWHMSLSNWFRDYLYVPLGGSRAGPRRLYFNLLTVFILCGLWHGASWTFVIWGLYHGLFLVAERIGVDRVINRLWRPFQHVYALLVVIVGWVFFRSEDVAYAITFLGAMFGMGDAVAGVHPIGGYLTTEVSLTLAVGILGSGALHRFGRGGQGLVGRSVELAPTQPRTAPWQAVIEPIYLILVFVVASVYLMAGTYNPFIYFRF